ncbi:MAG: hypothetical protein U0930_20640 [Pirellulales bacterium]
MTMYFHFPIHQAWNAESIAESLLRRDIDAKVRGGEVVISFRLKFFGFIIGEIRDGVDGVPEPAVVRGRVASNKSIWFSKTYPRSWALDSATGSRCIFDNRKLVVHYLGTFKDLETICGTWEIRAFRRAVNGKEYQLPRMSGSWNAKACC